jgi:DNA segregation ATPase FtsK/SpoIIIE-like protein
LGEDVAGGARVADLVGMPHLLIAGATGAGKSVLLNVLITCILMQASPDDVQLLLVDPKMVEFTLYANVPHLLAPIVTDPRAVADLLRNAVNVMEGRYRRFAELGVRNLDGYRRLQVSQPEMRLAALPNIVLVIDELADVMLVAGKDVADLLARLAQLSRATGMHLVVATQRPEVKVITGLIKANFPARIAFMVSSAVDSCTILDRGGAEDLLGRGDMLYLPAEQSDPDRIQGTYVSDEESKAVADFWRRRAESAAQHLAAAIDLPEQHAFQAAPQAAAEPPEEGAPRNAPDPLQGQVEAYVCTQPRVSVSLLQRRFNLGYNRAANIMDELVRKGMVGSDDGTNRGRTVLVHLQDGSESATPAVVLASNQNKDA